MKDLLFTITIHASKQRVWHTLWQDETFRDWASLIDPGTYMVGELAQGNEVQFISSQGGYGVTSLVEQLIPNESLVLRHQADTQDEGKNDRDKEWTGGTERYTLTEQDGTTTLTVAFDVPAELEDYFTINYPTALRRVKLLAEQT